MKDVKETRNEKTKQKKMSRGYLSFMINLLIVVLVSMIVLTGCKSVHKTNADDDKKEWTIEMLQSKESVDYVLVDRGVLEYDKDIAQWVEKTIEQKGVHSHLTDDHTFILITAGKNSEDQAIQLYDVRSDEERIYVGYDLQEVEKKEEGEVAMMLVRLDRVEKSVEGRNITN